MIRSAFDLKLRLGDQAPYFSLPSTDGRICSLSDFTDANAFVVIFTSNYCPQSRAYERRIVDLVYRYRSDGVAFVAICSNNGEAFPEDNFENMIEKSARMEFALPYLHDQDQNVARAYDAVCTSEVFLFDSAKSLRYHGMLDDNPMDQKLVTVSYLEDALEALLAGSTPELPLTAATGCPIRWKNR